MLLIIFFLCFIDVVFIICLVFKDRLLHQVHYIIYNILLFLDFSHYMIPLSEYTVNTFFKIFLTFFIFLKLKFFIVFKAFF